jgi:hypothetical protein
MQFNVKIDFAEKSLLNTDFAYTEKWDGGAMIEFENYNIKLSTIRHDRLARRDSCFVNLKLEEIKNESTGRWELFMTLNEAYGEEFDQDSEGCWSGMDFETELTPVDTHKQLANDENYLSNMALLEDLLDPSMFEKSILGTWDIAVPDDKGEKAVLNEFFENKDPKTGEDLDTKNQQARLGLRIIDF